MTEGKEWSASFKVFWSVLMERSIPEVGAASLFNVAMVAGATKMGRISVPYMRVDWARNVVAKSFLEATDDPNDLLIMLDCDHKHPDNILPLLAGHDPELGVVGALAFRRGPPYEPMFFLKSEAGLFRSPAEWEKGTCYQCDALGMAAIGIRRWVFTRLDECGYTWPYFRFDYPAYCSFNKSEDIYFCESCGEAGIKMFCNTGIVCPHIGTVMIDDETWEKQYKAHAGAERYEDAMHDDKVVPDDARNPGLRAARIQTRVDL